MSEETHQSASALSPLPDAPNLEWLRKQAKHRLAELRKTSRDAKLSDASGEVSAVDVEPSEGVEEAGNEGIIADLLG